MAQPLQPARPLDNVKHGSRDNSEEPVMSLKDKFKAAVKKIETQNSVTNLLQDLSSHTQAKDEPDTNREDTKDHRANLRMQIIKNKTGLFLFIASLLQKTTPAKFIAQLEKLGYKQVIKSKTRSTETSILTEDNFLKVVETMTSDTLDVGDLEALRECVQLTPKFQNLYTLKLLAVFIQEVD